MRSIVTLAVGVLATASTLTAQDVNPPRDLVQPPRAEYSPYVDDHFPNRVFFGDTHLHSSWSTDAGMGGATLGPDDAYGVSRGEEVGSHLGWRVKLIRPLDFLVLADHAENLGLADFIRRSDPILLANETGRRWHDLSKAGNGYDAFLEWLSEPRDLIDSLALETFHASGSSECHRPIRPSKRNCVRVGPLFNAGGARRELEAMEAVGEDVLGHPAQLVGRENWRDVRYVRAEVYSALGEAGPATRILARPLAEPTGVTAEYLEARVAWDGIRDDPGFAALLTR